MWTAGLNTIVPAGWVYRMTYQLYIGSGCTATGQQVYSEQLIFQLSTVCVTVKAGYSSKSSYLKQWKVE